MRLFALAALIFAWFGQPALAQDLRVNGLDGRTRVFTEAEIGALPRAALTIEQHGETHVYEGVALATLLTEVAAPLGRELRGPALALVVLITCEDGYKVALALADADPDFASQAVLLADRRDGLPIAAPDGPFRLVVEGDKRPARSARMVTSIEILRLAPVEPAADAH